MSQYDVENRYSLLNIKLNFQIQVNKQNDFDSL